MAQTEDAGVRIYRPVAEESGRKPEPECKPLPPEHGGRKDGTDPTRFGDWEKQGRCIDF